MHEELCFLRRSYKTPIRSIIGSFCESIGRCWRLQRTLLTLSQLLRRKLEMFTLCNPPFICIALCFLNPHTSVVVLLNTPRTIQLQTWHCHGPLDGETPARPCKRSQTRARFCGAARWRVLVESGHRRRLRGRAAAGVKRSSARDSKDRR